MNQSPRSSNNQVSRRCSCHPFQGPVLQFYSLSCWRPVPWAPCTWACHCSGLWLVQQRKSCLMLSRLVASFSLLRVDLHFCVLTSPAPSKILPVLSSSLLRQLACVGSRIKCSQQSEDHSGTGLLELLFHVGGTFVSVRKCAQHRCLHFLNCSYMCVFPIDFLSSWRGNHRCVLLWLLDYSQISERAERVL